MEWQNKGAQLDLQPLPSNVRVALCDRLERSFDKMFEAVEYRLDVLHNFEVRHFDLIPAGEYEAIRIYASDVEKVRVLMSAGGQRVAYVSFIGSHRPDVMVDVEATDRALIGKSPADSPILGYFSLQDPYLAWVNLVLFDDIHTVNRWVSATAHADDWKLAASFFTRIEKSIGYLEYRDGRTVLEPMRLVTRNYELA